MPAKKSENVIKVSHTFINPHSSGTVDPVLQMRKLRLTTKLRNLSKTAKLGERGQRRRLQVCPMGSPHFLLQFWGHTDHPSLFLPVGEQSEGSYRQLCAFAKKTADKSRLKQMETFSLFLDRDSIA